MSSCTVRAPSAPQETATLTSIAVTNDFPRSLTPGQAFVRRDRAGAAHTFTAAVGRDALIGRRLQDVAEKLCGGSLTPLLTHLVRTRRLSEDERKELRSLIDALEPRNKNKGESR